MAEGGVHSQEAQEELLHKDVKDAIRKNYTFIVEETTVDGVLDKLYEQNVLENDDLQRIRYEVTDQCKARKCLEIISCKNDSCNLKFVQALRDHQEHVWKRIIDTKVESRCNQSLSHTLREQETLNTFLKMCARDCMQLKDGTNLEVSKITTRFQKEARESGLHHTVSTEDIILVIQKVFPYIKIEQWQSRSKKGKKQRTTAESNVIGVTWKTEPGGEIQHHVVETTEIKTIVHNSTISQLDIDTWDKTEVYEWMKTLDVDNCIADAFKKEDVTGDVLSNIKRNDIKEICPQASFGHQKRIIAARDQILERSDTRSEVLEVDNFVIDNETPRTFDLKPSPGTVYRKGRHLPSPNQHTGDPLEVITKYILISQDDIERDNLLSTFQRRSAEFACACINERNNGTLVFGADTNGLIVGMAGEKSMWQQQLKDCMKNFFYADERDKVSKCIRPLRFISVSDGDRQASSLFVIEIDIVPAFQICREDAFLIRKLAKRNTKHLFVGTCLMRIRNSNVIEISDKADICSFMNMKSQLASNRAQREQESLKNRDVSCGLRSKLRQLLCRGEATLDGDIFPILVTSRMPGHYEEDEMREQFRFMKDLPWKAVFDFDDGSGLYQYLEDCEEQVFKVLHVEDFDQSFVKNQCEKDRLQNILQDLKISSQRPWIFANGRDAEDMQPEKVIKWKQERSEGFKEAVRYMKNEIPKGRAVVVFMLFSKDYDVMLEAADELATKFGNQWFTLSATHEVADQWQDGIHQKHLIENKKDLDQRSVLGIPWKHVNDSIYDILGTISEDICDLPTSEGAVVKLTNKTRNDWIDLDVLGVRQCKNDNITTDDQDSLYVRSEEEFYRGGEVDWLNFFFKDHVLERSCISDLLECVRNTLLGRTDQEDRVERISLYHQPGAGGTTTAKQILWKLKEHHRCAVVKKITSDTCRQITAFHSYEDPNPKPVLLLFDNLDDERVSTLRAELEETSKQMTRHCIPNEIPVTYVFLLCVRKTSLPLHQGSRYFRLSHELATDEQFWFKRKYQDLKKKYEEKARSGVNPKHLISFNIMKENFNPEFIAKTVKDVLSEISDRKERVLLKYVSLLNSYDLGFQTLPASAFDAIMEYKVDTWFIQSQRWELHLSQALRILLYQVDKKKQNDGQHIRIIHNTLSRKILDILIDDQSMNSSKDSIKAPLASAVDQFIDCGIFCMTYPDNSVDRLLKVVRDVVKQRAHNPQNGKPETKFAPLIEDIIYESKQSVDEAAFLLENIYVLSDDVFVGQQLARLYIHAKNWLKAEYFAKQITDKKSGNSFLWDTYGNAVKEQIKEKYEDCIANTTVMSIYQALPILDLAFKAISIFQKEQEVSEYERTTYVNNAGYFQELQVVVILLDCLSITNELREDNVLHKVLVREIQMPLTLSRVLGNVRVDGLLRIQNGVDKAMARLEDEHLQLRDDMADEYRKSSLRRGTDTLIRYKESLERHYGEESDTVPVNFSVEEACKYRRRRIFRLAGNTFRAVFELRRKENGEMILLKIRCMIQENMRSETDDVFDLQMLLSINLTLCCIDDHHKTDITRQEMSEMANRLYQSIAKGSDFNLEPYLFAAMFNWPYQSSVTRQPIPANEIPEILMNWRKAYYSKYPRQRDEGRPYRKKETTMFFLGNGADMSGIAFDQELKGHGVKRNNVYFWRMPHVLERLERWQGTLINDGSDVRISIVQGGNKMSLVLPTSFPITTRGWWSKKVYFVIGFTWAGPKAFDISMEVPRKREVEIPFQMAIRNAKPQPRLRVYSDYNRRRTFSYPVYLEEYNKIKEQLDSIANIEGMPYEQRTSYQKQLCNRKMQLRQKLDELQHTISALLKDYKDLHTNY